MAQVIIALDVPTLDEAMGLVDALGEETDFYKVGLELFTREGPSVVHALRGRTSASFSTSNCTISRTRWRGRLPEPEISRSIS